MNLWESDYTLAEKRTPQGDPMKMTAQRLRGQWLDAIRKGREWASRFTYRGQHR